MESGSGHVLKPKVKFCNELEVYIQTLERSLLECLGTKRGRWHWFLRRTVQLPRELLHCDYFRQAVTQMDLTAGTRKVKGLAESRAEAAVSRRESRELLRKGGKWGGWEMVGTRSTCFERMVLKADRKAKQRWLTSDRCYPIYKGIMEWDWGIVVNVRTDWAFSPASVLCPYLLLIWIEKLALVAALCPSAFYCWVSPSVSYCSVKVCVQEAWFKTADYYHYSSREREREREREKEKDTQRRVIATKRNDYFLFKFLLFLFCSLWVCLPI